jgi:hypothetical protein
LNPTKPALAARPSPAAARITSNRVRKRIDFDPAAAIIGSGPLGRQVAETAIAYSTSRPFSNPTFVLRQRFPPPGQEDVVALCFLALLDHEDGRQLECAHVGIAQNLGGHPEL